MENKYERRLDIIWDDSVPERGEFGKKFENKEEKELFLACNCKSEVLGIQKFADEDEYYLTVFKYRSESHTFIERLKLAWKVFRGEGINTADVVLSSENFEKLKQF